MMDRDHIDILIMAIRECKKAEAMTREQFVNAAGVFWDSVTALEEIKVKQNEGDQ